MLGTSCAVLLCAASAAQDEFAAPWNGYDLSVQGWPEAATAADLDLDGDVDVATTHLPDTTSVAVVRNDGFGAFGPPAYFPHRPDSEGARAVLAADLDGDGVPDLAVANADFPFGGNTVARLRGLGDGAFAPYETFDVTTDPTLEPGPYALAALDLDLDGRLDLATANYGPYGNGSDVGLLYNDGAGGFLPVEALDTGPSPVKVEAGDVDGDGYPDLVVGREDDVIAVHLGGAAGFAPYAAYVALSGTSPASALALADLDRDLDLDVLWGTEDLRSLRNQGDGTFGPPEEIVLVETASPVGIEVGDVTGDGWPDVVAAHTANDDWTLIRGDGAGGFLSSTSYHAGEWPSDVELFDADGDGDLDPVVVGHFSRSLSVYRNPGDGDLAPPPVIPLGGYLHVDHEYADAGDVDGDGDLDAVSAFLGYYPGGESGVAVLENGGPAGFSPAAYPFPAPLAAKLADLDGDGFPDLLCASELNGFVVRRNLGDGTFGPALAWTTPECAEVRTVEAADVDGDTDLDVVLLAQECGYGVDSTYHVYLNLGDGTFTALVQSPAQTYAEDFLLADLDLNGIADAASTTSGSSSVERGVGDGAFAHALDLAAGGARLVAADLDADGRPDLATLGLGVAVFLSQPGGFSPGTVYGTVPFYYGIPRQIAAGDGDGDGDVDLLVANSGSHSVSMYPNKGSGSLGADLVFGCGREPRDVVAGDFDGDGALDLGLVVEAGFLEDGFTVLPGQPGGAPWSVLGGGLPGTLGIPALLGAGTLKTGGDVTLSLEDAFPDSLAAFVLGLSQLDVPLFGGTLVPAPHAVVLVPTGAGEPVLEIAPLPVLPPGQAAYAQAWVIDPGAPQGVAASNAVAAP